MSWANVKFFDIWISQFHKFIGSPITDASALFFFSLHFSFGNVPAIFIKIVQKDLVVLCKHINL